MANPIRDWHSIIGSRNFDLLEAILSDDVVFHSPVVHTPQVGRDRTSLYLNAAFHVFLNDTFRYVREVVGERDAVLEFSVEIDGVTVNGVDMLKWNDDGKLTEIKVMLRPLRAIQLIQKMMAAFLENRANLSG